MRLAGLTRKAFVRIARNAEISWDAKERAATYLAHYLGGHIQSTDRPELAVWSNLYKFGDDLVFQGSEVLDQSFESDEMVELLWDVKEAMEKFGLETQLEDDWTVRFVEAL